MSTPCSCKLTKAVVCAAAVLLPAVYYYFTSSSSKTETKDSESKEEQVAPEEVAPEEVSPEVDAVEEVEAAEAVDVEETKVEEESNETIDAINENLPTLLTEEEVAAPVSKFSVGDNVTCSYGSGHVVEYRPETTIYKVQLDSWSLSDNQPVFVYCTEEILFASA